MENLVFKLIFISWCLIAVFAQIVKNGCDFVLGLEKHLK